MTNEEKNKHAGIWHEIIIKEISGETMRVQFKEKEFTLPIGFIKHQVKPGDALYLQVLDAEQKEHSHGKLAKNILNSILGN